MSPKNKFATLKEFRMDYIMQHVNIDKSYKEIATFLGMKLNAVSYCVRQMRAAGLPVADSWGRASVKDVVRRWKKTRPSLFKGGSDGQGK